MKSIGSVLQCLVLIASICVIPGCSQTNDETSKLVGDWTGDSTCVNKEKFPACNDEKVVYHLKSVAGKANVVNLSADKIVNGKPEFMGEFDFVYDPRKQTLTSEFKNERVHLLLEFLVKGDILEGSMISLPDRTQARQMRVTKNK
ncbi:MAG: hypothetical protein ACJ72Z_13810 [Pyrinomonadaceae bacterium]